MGRALFIACTITLLVTAPSTAREAIDKSVSFAGLDNNDPTSGWTTHYDGVQASAVFTFNQASIVENNHAISDGAADGYVQLECGDDGYNIMVHVPYAFSSLRNSRTTQVKIAGSRYTFLRVDGAFVGDQSTLFVGDQSTLSKSEFNQILKAMYETDDLVGFFRIFVVKGSIEISLSIDNLDWNFVPKKKDAVGLIRSACR